MEFILYIGVIFFFWALFAERKSNGSRSTNNQPSDYNKTVPLRYRNLPKKEQEQFLKHEKLAPKAPETKSSDNFSLPLGAGTKEKEIETKTFDRSLRNTKIDPLSWFKDFEHFISECVKISNSNAKIRSELKGDTRLNRVFLEMKSGQNQKQTAQQFEEKSKSSPSLPEDAASFRRHLLKNFPKNSLLSNNSTQNYSARDQYVQALENHNNFIALTLSKIKAQEFGTSEFKTLLQNVDMTEILEQHFPTICDSDNEDPKNHITDSGQLPPNLISKTSRHASIKEIANRRGIYQLVHFTRLENFKSIIEKGIKPVSALERENVSFIRNDQKRLDGHLNATSISISFPNFKTFFKMRMESQQSEWVVLLIKPDVLWEKECGFFPLNAASSEMRSKNLDQLKDPSSFDAMFSTNYGDREYFLGDCDPTNSQAEVMVFGTIEPDYIDTIAFQCRSSANNFETYRIGLAFDDFERQKSIKSIKRIKVLDRDSSDKFFGTREKSYSPF